MTYVDQRDAILDHAKAAALATDPKWTNVAVGMPVIKDAKGCRVFYGGEDEAPKMPAQRDLEGELIGEHVSLVAWWQISGLAVGALAVVDTQMFTFKHELRTRVTADQTLGGKSSGIDMDYADPDVVVIDGTRYAILGADFSVAHTEYLY